MLIAINGQPQRSFEQFEKTFKQTFERDMTQDERRLFEPAFLKPDLKAAFQGDGRPHSKRTKN